MPQRVIIGDGFAIFLPCGDADCLHPPAPVKKFIREDTVYPYPPAPAKKFICAEKLPYGNFTCWSKDCPDHNYRVKGKWKAKALRGSGSKSVSLWAITLPIGKYLPQDVLGSVRQAFNRKMRMKERTFEYFWVLHYDSGLFNHHLLAKTIDELHLNEIEEQWRRAMDLKADRQNLIGSFYCEPCYSWYGYVNYSVQGSPHDPMEKTPTRGLYRNLYGITRGFQSL
jgi:hypothetical protein